MNTKSLVFLLALFATPAYANDSPLRIGLAGELSLDMQQEIFVSSREEAIAGRSFSMRFAFGEPDDAGRVPVELKSARASYTAHGMKQRLPASHLVGTTFSLSDDGHSVQASGAKTAINLGQVTDGELVPGELLAGLLPVLPAEALTSGSAWVSEQSFDTLVGWSWAGGDIVYDNKVTGLREDHGESILSILSRGRAPLVAAPGRKGFVGEGELERSIEWSIEAATGRIVTYKLEQQASGTSLLPQGEVPVRQLTRIELSGS